MNELAQEQASVSSVDWNERFLGMLPQIRVAVSFALRNAPRHCRDENIAECIANAFCAFTRLVQRGRADHAHPTVLARFAVMQMRTGRKVGSRINSLDVMSRHAQRRHGIEVVPLQEQDGGKWEDLVIQDKHSTPADLATIRLDFRAWLRRLGRTKRAVAACLARGEGTAEAANRFGLSSSRISQLRREFESSWEQFQAEPGCLSAA
jgi:hypothetical protein